MANNKSEIGLGVNFERIRRITGYLTGSVDTWNNSKRAELADRVNHSSGLEERFNGRIKEAIR